MPEGRSEKNRSCCCSSRFTFGDLRDARRDVVAVVELDEEVAGDPEREEVDRHRRRRSGRRAGGSRRTRARARGGRRQMIPITRPADPAARLVGALDRPRTRPSASCPRGRCSRRRCAPRTCRRSRRRSSGVAKTSIEAIRLAVKTWFRSAGARAGRQHAEADPEESDDDRAPARAAGRRGSRRDARRARRGSRGARTRSAIGP